MLIGKFQKQISTQLTTFTFYIPYLLFYIYPDLSDFIKSPNLQIDSSSNRSISKSSNR